MNTMNSMGFIRNKSNSNLNSLRKIPSLDKMNISTYKKKIVTNKNSIKDNITEECAVQITNLLYSTNDYFHYNLSEEYFTKCFISYFINDLVTKQKKYYNLVKMFIEDNSDNVEVIKCVFIEILSPLLLNNLLRVSIGMSIHELLTLK